MSGAGGGEGDEGPDPATAAQGQGQAEGQATWKKEIEDAANALALAAPSIGSGLGKAYEAWVTLELAKGLKDVGVFVQARDCQDDPTVEFYFRRNPGKIKSATTSPYGQACHLFIAGSGGALEIHAGVQHRGMSQDLHEIDISIVPHDEAAMARSFKKDAAYFGSRCVALELKEYGDHAFIDKGIPRALLGVMADLDPVLIAARAAQLPGSRCIMVSQVRPAPHYGLLTTAKIRPPSKTFLSAHGVQWAEGLNCRDDNDAIEQLAQRVADLLRRR